MICHDCGRDDKEVLSDDLPVAEVVRLCKEWKCKLCRRTQEEVQADFDTEAMRNPHKSAHDWGSIKVPNLKVTGAPPTDDGETNDN